MGQRLTTWRSGSGDRLWLSLLIDAMEEAARPEVRFSALRERNPAGLARAAGAAGGALSLLARGRTPLIFLALIRPQS
jgi:hypothetical protein